MAKFTLTATVRADEGKGASRRLRRTDRVPAIIYGAHKPAESLSFDHNELWLAMKKESFFSSILTLKLGGADQPAIIKAVQRHPVLPRLVHLDFQRVSENEEIRVHVPLHFLNETTSVGVKTQGGALSRNMIEIEVACLPKHLPEYIEVDVAALEINHALHLSQLTLPEGVRIPALTLGKSHDLPVVSIQHMRVTTEEDLATAAP